FFEAEDGIRDATVTGVQTCALPISPRRTGVSPTTVRRGVTELDSGEEPLPVGRVRRAGGGRKPVTAHDPELVTTLLGLVEPNARSEGRRVGEECGGERWRSCVRNDA